MKSCEARGKMLKWEKNQRDVERLERANENESTG